MRNLISQVFLLITLMLFPTQVYGSGIILEYKGKVVLEIKDAKNLEKLKTEKLNVSKHPNYLTKLNYYGVSFKQLSEKYDLKIGSSDLVVVTCADGYRPVLKGSFFQDGKAFLALGEVEPEKSRKTDDGQWTKVKMEDEYVSPAPGFIVWPDIEGHKHSWPYQVVKIEVVEEKNFKEFEKIRPIKNTNASRGFELFKKNCIKCHSIKYIGPKGKAPDLAYVKGYRTDSFIKKRIRKGKGKMPPFSKKKISDEDIKNLIEYFKYNLEK